jgi:hypothetical protein
MAGWEADWSRDVLERIVALLFALAGLADLAAGAPFLRRRRVLAILDSGEAEARAFLLGTASGAAVSMAAPESADDAARLAARLRALALLLCMMLAQPPLPAPCAALGPRAGQDRYAGRAGRPAAPPAPDTS